VNAGDAAWVAIGLTVAAALIRDGIRRGKIDTVLDHVLELLDDLDDRVRYIERRPPRPPRKRGQRGRHSGT
jgi:hypothetical protein